MCGIAGAVGRIDDAIRLAVAAMTDAQAHRGPDAEGYWEDIASDGTGVALGHRRLSILDLSHAADQPMIDQVTGHALCFNGEIYNFRTLRGELSKGCQEFETESDTEVLLRACTLWGEKALARLRGMFAFAHWDPARRCLLLARDRLGIKPLYTVRLNRPGGPCLLFASELRALLASGLVERRLDPLGLDTYLWNGFTVAPSTMIRLVKLLEPATYALVDPAEPQPNIRKYWQLPHAGIRNSADSELAAQMTDAVRLHLAADVPLGVFLSGGVDSSAVAALAAQSGAGAIQTFNVAFDEVEYDESDHARAVASELGTDHHEIRLSERIFRDQLGDALGALDQPTFDALNTYFVSRAAREAGITVALAGTGGDEMFGGYRSFSELPRAQWWSRRLGFVPESLWRATNRRVGQWFARSRGKVPPQTRWGKLADVLATRGQVVPLYQVFYALFTEEFRAELRAAPGAGAADHGLPLCRFRDLECSSRAGPLLHTISLLEMTLFLGERLLRDTDAASMAVGLEVRVPLLDHCVVEALSGIHPVDRFQPLGRKKLLRELALSQLRPKTFERPKAGFVLPIEKWCRQLLRDEVATTLGDADLCTSVGLTPSAVNRLWNSFQAGAPGLYWSRIWALFVLLDWCRRQKVHL